MRPLKWWVTVVVLALLVSGCASLMHDLKPHRLRRLNRGPAPSLDPEFSAAPAPCIDRLA